MYAYEHYLYAPNGTQMTAWNDTSLTSTFVWTNSSYDFTNARFGTWNYSVTGSDIGGLNIVSKNYSFDVVANNPPEVTLSFTVDPVFETQNEVASAYYTDVENHTGVINWYWYVNAISVFNETTNNVLNATTSYSTLLSGNYSATDTISLTINAFDGYNHTTVSDDIVVSTSSSGTGGTKFIIIQRNCFLFWC
jgi:hypothetical protein